MTTIAVPEFRHTPLPDPKAYIRLFKVVSVPAGDAAVHCKISTWPSNEAPEYRAVSYTWGDASQLSTIIIDGGRMEVRSNCEYVLRQTSAHVGDGYLWIDAICIDQRYDGDNKEKNAQVAQMGHVYKTATQVLACVGRHGDDSEFLYRMMKQDEPLFRPWLAEARKSKQIIHSSIRHYPSLLRWRLKHRGSNRLRKALELFLERPYFRRVWIYQELFLGQNILLLCNGDSVFLSSVWMTFSALHASAARLQQYSLHSSLFLNLNVLASFHSLADIRIEDMLRVGATDQTFREISSAMIEVELLQCQDPRDRLYGVLAIIDWAGDQPIHPDYSKDPFDLAVEALAWFIDSCEKKLLHPGMIWRYLHFAASIARCFALSVSPTTRLTEAIQSRTSLPIETSPITPSTTLIKRERVHSFQYKGLRITCTGGRWKFQHYMSGGRQPQLNIWDNQTTNRTQQIKSDILLPPDAQSGDWLLVSESYMGVGFVARDCAGGNGHLDFVAKALIKVGDWPQDELLDSIQLTHLINMDAEDLLVLCRSCGWDRGIYFWEDRIDTIDQYFKTRLYKDSKASVVISTKSPL